MRKGEKRGRNEERKEERQERRRERKYEGGQGKSKKRRMKETNERRKIKDSYTDTQIHRGGQADKHDR